MLSLFFTYTLIPPICPNEQDSIKYKHNYKRYKHIAPPCLGLVSPAFSKRVILAVNSFCTFRFSLVQIVPALAASCFRKSGVSPGPTYIICSLSPSTLARACGLSLAPPSVIKIILLIPCCLSFLNAMDRYVFPVGSGIASFRQG